MANKDDLIKQSNKYFKETYKGFNNYKLVFSYDGSQFFGYAKQPDKRSVEECINNALNKLLNEDIKIYASGRTDKGVHALNQVINFYTKINIIKKYKGYDSFLYKLNKLIDKDIFFKTISKKDILFNARFNAKKKEYFYLINNKVYDPLKRNYEAYVYNFNKEKVEEITPLFIGTHSFKNFTSKEIDDNDFIRTIYDIKIKRYSNGYKIIFIGDGFMKYEIRKIVGTLLAYNDNKINKEEIASYIYNKDRKIINYQAEAKGLYLAKVIY